MIVQISDKAKCPPTASYNQLKEKETEKLALVTCMEILNYFNCILKTPLKQKAGTDVEQNEHFIRQACMEVVVPFLASLQPCHRLEVHTGEEPQRLGRLQFQARFCY